MSQINFDLKKLTAGGFNPTTGAVVAPVEIMVHENTLDLVETDETETPIRQAGKKTPVRILRGGDGIEEMTFNVLDTSAASQAFWLGGTVTTLDGKSTYNKPKGKVAELIKFIEAETPDGTIMRIPRGSVKAKKDYKVRTDGVFVITVKVTPTDTGLPAIADFQMDDPEEAE